MIITVAVRWIRTKFINFTYTRDTAVVAKAIAKSNSDEERLMYCGVIESLYDEMVNKIAEINK